LYRNSDVPLEIDFSSVEFRNEVHINEDDEIYIGQFKIGTSIKEGRGIMLTASKDLYEGYWVNNEKCGKGRMIFCNGDVYQGDWACNESQGVGVFINDEGKYKGEWVSDQRDGFGTFIWEDGRKYTGEWLEDKQHGKVAYIDANGNQVIGQYIQGEFVIEGQEQQSQSNIGGESHNNSNFGGTNPFMSDKILGQLKEHNNE